MTNLSTACFGHERVERHHDATSKYATYSPLGNGILAKTIPFYSPCGHRAAEHALEFENRLRVILTSRASRCSRFASKTAFSFEKARRPSELGNRGVNSSSRNMRFNNAPAILSASEPVEIYRQSVTGKEMVKAIAAAIQRASNLCDGFACNVSSMKSE